MENQLTLFNQYESEYCNKSTDVARKIDGLTAFVGDQRRRKVSDLEYEIREAEHIVKRMETEARSFAPDRSQQVMSKIRDYKSDLQGLKDSLKGASRAPAASAESARKDLGLGTEYFSTTSSQRDTMLRATQQANQSTEQLKYGTKLLNEAEIVGAHILEELDGQRRSIVRSTNKIQDAQEAVKQSQATLSRMTKRSKWFFWP